MDRGARKGLDVVVVGAGAIGLARERALALDGAHLFDPGERDRPMKEWVVVPEAHAKEWPQLAERALR